MARMDLRLRAWGAITRRQSSVATRSDADVIALQSRKIPKAVRRLHPREGRARGPC